MENHSSRYVAYMLRMWQVGGESPAWRASLEEARTGKRYGFGSLELLFQFLTEQASASSEACEDSARSSDRTGFDLKDSG